LRKPAPGPHRLRPRDSVERTCNLRKPVPVSAGLGPAPDATPQSPDVAASEWVEAARD